MAFKDKHFRSVFYILLMGIFVLSRFVGSLQPGFFAVTNEKEEGRLGVGTYLGFITLFFFSRIFSLFLLSPTILLYHKVCLHGKPMQYGSYSRTV